MVVVGSITIGVGVKVFAVSRTLVPAAAAALAASSSALFSSRRFFAFSFFRRLRSASLSSALNGAEVAPAPAVAVIADTGGLGAGA